MEKIDVRRSSDTGLRSYSQEVEGGDGAVTNSKAEGISGELPAYYRYFLTELMKG